MVLASSSSSCWGKSKCVSGCGCGRGCMLVCRCVWVGVCIGVFVFIDLTSWQKHINIPSNFFKDLLFLSFSRCLSHTDTHAHILRCLLHPVKMIVARTDLYQPAKYTHTHTHTHAHTSHTLHCLALSLLHTHTMSHLTVDAKGYCFHSFLTLIISKPRSVLTPLLVLLCNALNI